MARYLIVATYNAEGVQGVIEKGGTARREAVEKLLADLGGTVESFYFAFGDADAYVTVDLPDNVTAAAAALAVGASGKVSCRTVVLLTPEEVDRATQTKVNYRAPGS
jgi:uncharacterized protein with GYD domain